MAYRTSKYANTKKVSHDETVQPLHRSTIVDDVEETNPPWPNHPRMISGSSYTVHSRPLSTHLSLSSLLVSRLPTANLDGGNITIGRDLAQIMLVGIGDFSPIPLSSVNLTMANYHDVC